jgi:hypothetical protein
MSKNFDEINISMLFDMEPKIGWASRGNPYLWDEMRLKSKNIKLLENEDEMKNYFYELFKQITGISIFDKEYIKINKYLLDYGMSNGIVNCLWWFETGIPILLERYTQIKNVGIDDIIININNIKMLEERYENSIEEAMERIFLYNEININNLIELLEMDNNINRISKKIKNKILKEIKYKTNDENKINIVVEILNKSKNNCA